jgi:hypothetical protein
VYAVRLPVSEAAVGSDSRRSALHLHLQIRIEPDGKIPDIKGCEIERECCDGRLDDGPPVAMEWLGWQRDIGGVRVYLMHFPIRGVAAIRVRKLAEVKGASGEF